MLTATTVLWLVTVLGDGRATIVDAYTLPSAKACQTRAAFLLENGGTQAICLPKGVRPVVISGKGPAS